MSKTRRKVIDKISRKAKEIQEVTDSIVALETKRIALNAEKKGMEDILKMIPEDGEEEKETEIRPTSQMGKVQKLLKKEMRPMYIKDILLAMKRADNSKNRKLLSGSLRAYVRQGKVFSLPGPNTFGLIEWGNMGGVVTNDDTQKD